MTQKRLAALNCWRASHISSSLQKHTTFQLVLPHSGEYAWHESMSSIYRCLFHFTNISCLLLLFVLLTVSHTEKYIIKCKIMFNKKKTLFTSKLDLNLRKKLVKYYIWSMALYGAETWMLQAADQKYLESFEMWC